jgi:hypothetical protein
MEQQPREYLGYRKLAAVVVQSAVDGHPVQAREFFKSPLGALQLVEDRSLMRAAPARGPARPPPSREERAGR